MDVDGGQTANQSGVVVIEMGRLDMRCVAGGADIGLAASIVHFAEGMNDLVAQSRVVLVDLAARTSQ